MRMMRFDNILVKCQSFARARRARKRHDKIIWQSPCSFFFYTAATLSLLSPYHYTRGGIQWSNASRPHHKKKFKSLFFMKKSSRASWPLLPHHFMVYIYWKENIYIFFKLYEIFSVSVYRRYFSCEYKYCRKSSLERRTHWKTSILFNATAFSIELCAFIAKKNILCLRSHTTHCYVHRKKNFVNKKKHPYL